MSRPLSVRQASIVGLSSKPQVRSPQLRVERLEDRTVPTRITLLDFTPNDINNLGHVVGNAPTNQYYPTPNGNIPVTVGVLWKPDTGEVPLGEITVNTIVYTANTATAINDHDHIVG